MIGGTLLLIPLGMRTFLSDGRRPAQTSAKREIRSTAGKAPFALHLSVPIITSAVSFPVKTTHGEINGCDADASAVASYSPLLASEWNLYPASLIKRTGLRRVILCDNLIFAGQRRAAVPDFENHDLYIDVVRGRYDEQYTRCVIHHEFFHLIDYCDDGELYHDGRWEELNLAGFRYGTGGVNAQRDASGSLINEKLPGFLNSYSTTGVEEDKAELFANLIVRGKLVAARAQSDPFLKAKIARLKELLQELCSDMGDEFWINADKVERPEQPNERRS